MCTEVHQSANTFDLLRQLVTGVGGPRRRMRGKTLPRSGTFRLAESVATPFHTGMCTGVEPERFGAGFYSKRSTYNLTHSVDTRMFAGGLN